MHLVVSGGEQNNKSCYVCVGSCPLYFLHWVSHVCTAVTSDIVPDRIELCKGQTTAIMMFLF